MPAYGVLVLPGGTEIGLELRRALAELKEVRLAGAGSEQDRHGPFAYRHWRTVPPVGEPGWIDTLNAVVEELGIDVIFPGHDDKTGIKQWKDGTEMRTLDFTPGYEYS